MPFVKFKPPFFKQFYGIRRHFLNSLPAFPPVIKSWTFILSMIFLISSKYMISYVSKCIFSILVCRVLNSEWFNPNTSLVKWRIWIVLLVRFLIHWNFKVTLSFSVIRIWRKAFSVSANEITVSNLVLIRVSHNLFWRDGLFPWKLLREYPGSGLTKTCTSVNFVDSAFCPIAGLCGRKNSFWIFTLIFWNLFFHDIY